MTVTAQRTGAASVPVPPPGEAAAGRIRLEHISLRYGPASPTAPSVLQDIGLELAGDEFICVLGPSGCGKSSLLNLIAGYIQPSEGRIVIDGAQHSAPDTKVGVVFQHANLFPWLSVARNVEFGLKMAGMPKAERRRKAQAYLELVGLASAASMYPHQLSGGMKQRAAIARTLAADPSIILMDEPFSALDALTRESMQTHVGEIWRKTGKCILFITHDVDEALLLGRRILLLHPSPGRIVEDFANPLHAEGKAPLRSSREFAELREWLIGRIADGAPSGAARQGRTGRAEAMPLGGPSSRQEPYRP
ncbi:MULTISPECIES: ABC transporter ATP-binding protein [Paenibacillus]|uniref:ABC transporter ATP-binding protein n=1 Tax=Paenibacillus TaxID=44249 RepID=UPI000390024C|nr:MULTISPECIES: ABC transporter ATP-binding protein [Paenibacillus]CDN42224.1 Taurine import ATP-binding protein TauB [Paenibacillus sp. P22]